MLKTNGLEPVRGKYKTGQANQGPPRGKGVVLTLLLRSEQPVTVLGLLSPGLASSTHLGLALTGLS